MGRDQGHVGQDQGLSRNAWQALPDKKRNKIALRKAAGAFLPNDQQGTLIRCLDVAALQC
jgi:hypothetical protein